MTSIQPTPTSYGTGVDRFSCLSVPSARVPLSLLEQIAVGRSDLPAVLADLRARSGAEQVCLLSTCERTEVYAWWSDGGDPHGLLDALAANRGVQPALLHAAAEVTVGRAAVRHLLRVSAGLESFVLGEQDIVGQVRAATDVSRLSGAGGLELQRVLDAAVSTSRRVHGSTRLGAGARSVAATAVDLAADRNGGDLAGRHVVVVGAGQVARQAVDTAVRLGAAVTVCNRTRRHAERLRTAGASVVDLAHLVDVLARADVAIFATGAPHPLVDAGRLASVSAAADLLVLDLCVPRNVDPAVRGIPGVDLVDLADLRAQGRAECESVAHDLLSAEGIIAEEVDRYVRWLAGRSAVAPLRRLRADVE